MNEHHKPANKPDFKFDIMKMCVFLCVSKSLGSDVL